MEYRTVEGFQTEKPKTIDTESSKTTVYLRKNIVSVPNVDMDGLETDGTHWQYDEAQLTKEEYETYTEIQSAVQESSEEMQSQIDYIAMMAGIDIDVTADTGTEETEQEEGE